MIEYQKELLRRGEAFRRQFVKANPRHPELPLIDEDIAARKVSVANLVNSQSAFSISRSGERILIPSKEQLVMAARKDMLNAFGTEFDVPEPPDTLYEDVERFAKLGIEVEELEISYQPSFQFDPESELDPKHSATLPIWIEGTGVKPRSYFWQHIKDRKLPPDSAQLPEGWILRDRRAKPRSKDNWSQRYENDNFIESMIAKLRNEGKVATRHQETPLNSRFGLSPLEIEGTILPNFMGVTNANGIVEYPSVLEFNIVGNKAHPEWGRTDTSEWFRDKVHGNMARFYGGSSVFGGLAYVAGGLSDSRQDDIGFRLQLRYPHPKHSLRKATLAQKTEKIEKPLDAAPRQVKDAIAK